MHYELWTILSGNMIDDFATEDNALATVRELLLDAEPGAAGQLLLTIVHPDGSGATIAAGARLAARAGVPASASPRPPA